MLRAVVLLLPVFASAFPTVHNPPLWSSSTLGGMAFLHAGDSHGFNATQLDVVQKFAIVQFDKKANLAVLPGVSFEDRAIALARTVKARAPRAKTLLYINGMINFANSRLFNATAAATDPWLLAANLDTGAPLTISGNGVFNASAPPMRALIVADARYGLASGAFDGVFIDRADWASSGKCAHYHGHFDARTCRSLVPGQRQLFADLTAALGAGAIVLAKETGGAAALDWQQANAAMTSDTFCSAYCHGCNASADPAALWRAADAAHCAASIGTIANMSARGQLTESHAMGPLDGALGAAEREFTMAAFLVAAGNLSYFSYADWAGACWELAGTRWWPEYDRPLGAPLGPPATPVSAGRPLVFARNFSSGTTVWVDVENHEAKITWAQAQR